MPAAQVMIVEDESIIAMDIKSSLNRLGYCVSGMAMSGNAALKKVESDRPDLILMDIHLKGEMTGIEVSEVIKSQFQIPIVYLTANADSATFKTAKGTDPYGYILKPFGVKELGMAIELALHQHQKKQAVRASESWYAMAFQSIDEAVIATDPNGNVVFMNAAAESITNCSLQEAIDLPIEKTVKLQKKTQQLDYASTDDSTLSILSAAMREQTVLPIPRHTQLLSKSLEILPIEGSATAIRDAAGTVIGGIFIFRQKQEVPDREQPNSSGILSAPSYEDTSEDQLSENQLSENQPLEDRIDNLYTPSDYPSETCSIEDISLLKAFVRAFIEQQSIFLSNQNLCANSDARTAMLSSKVEGTIVTVKPLKERLTAIVKQDSTYWELIYHVLVQNNFFPVSQRTNGTYHFQYRAVPNQCQMYHTRASELVEAWYGKVEDNNGTFQKLARYNVLRHSILVLRRGSWHHIQRLVCTGSQLRIKTAVGDMFVALDEMLVWGLQT